MSRRLLVYAIVIIGLGSLSGSGGFGPTPDSRGAARAAAAVDSPSPADLELRRVKAFLESRRTALAEAEIETLAPVIVEEARLAGLAPELVLAVIHVESSGNAFAISHVGALGLMQLRPRTAEDVARRFGIEWRGPVCLFDPVVNVRLGVRYLDRMIERFGNLPTALAAYNAGPTRIAAHLRSGRPAPSDYSNRVLEAWHTASPRPTDTGRI